MRTSSIRVIRLLPGLVVLALAGCATTADQAPVASSAASDHNQPMIVADSAYINAVETRARSRGILVQWVNPPSKRLLATGD